jgi:hypothetical protein
MLLISQELKNCLRSFEVPILLFPDLIPLFGKEGRGEIY